MQTVTVTHRHLAIVTMFGRRQKCFVTAYGALQVEYLPDKTLWIERGEDAYAIPHCKPPFCLLFRPYWMSGIPVE